MAVTKVTLNAPFKAKGSDGNYKYFLCKEQYDFTAKTLILVDNLSVEKMFQNKTIYHYTVIIDSITYYLPGCYCVEYDVPYDPDAFVTNTLRHEEYMWSNGEIKDVYSAYKQILGKNVDNTYKIEYNYDLIEAKTGLSCDNLRQSTNKLPDQS